VLGINTPVKMKEEPIKINGEENRYVKKKAARLTSRAAL
jgi:hypothetical protein